MEKDEKGGGKSNDRAQKAKAKLSKESVPERYSQLGGRQFTQLQIGVWGL